MKPRLLSVHTSLNAAPKTKDTGIVAGVLFSQAVVGAQSAPNDLTDDDNVYYYIGEGLELEGETERWAFVRGS